MVIIKKLKNIFILILFVITNCHAQKEGYLKSPEAFQNEVDAVGLVFTMPAGYHAVPVNPNTELWYAFAIKHNTEDFEIRYSYWPLKEEMEKYRKCKLDTGCTMSDPNRTYRLRLEEQLLKLTKGEPQMMSKFPSEAVIKEFNGDEGGFTFFKINNAFGRGYSIAQTVVLHKDDVADLVITYLSNNRAKHDELMGAPFNALIFKP
jgi:hypothetical protein